MKRFHVIGRLAVIVTGLAGALAGLSVSAVPAAFAGMMIPPGGDPHGRPGVAGPHVPLGRNQQPPLPAHAHAMVNSGIPGWEIALIAAALVSAALTMICHRVRDARRMTISAT
jgi:hypothetical protein